MLSHAENLKIEIRIEDFAVYMTLHDLRKSGQTGSGRFPIPKPDTDDGEKLKHAIMMQVRIFLDTI